MKLRRILDWLGRELEVSKFDDVSNNGLQIEGPEEVTKVAFAVDASLESVNAAVAAGAQLLVVHHGISWGGGIRRIEGGVYNVVKAAIEGGLAVAAVTQQRNIADILRSVHIFENLLSHRSRELAAGAYR